ncbi:MAG: ABC transporter permease [Firmicutes bacterium]|nr:ABC transporter permease [Bacillota bacterium]
MNNEKLSLSPQNVIPPQIPPSLPLSEEERKAQKRQNHRIKLQKALRFKQKRLSFPYALIVAVFVIIPLIIMMVDAFREPIYETIEGVKTIVGYSLTFGNFDRFWAMGKDTLNFWKSIGNTFLLALLTTVFCLLLSYPLALALNRVKSGRKAILVMLFVAPMWINSLLRIYALKLLFSNVEYEGFWLVLLGMVYDFFPFMLLPIYVSLSGTDTSYYEAAADLGASPAKTLLSVKLPLSKQGIVSGIIMTFMPAMSTFAISRIMSSGKLFLFANVIEEVSLQKAVTGTGSAYSMVLLLIVAVTFFIANRFTSVKGEARAEGVL